MKRIVVMCLMFAALGCATHTALPEEEIAIKGVAIGDNEGKVIRLLGQPRLRQEGSGSYDVYYEYDGMTVSFAGGMAESILAIGKDACTPSGVCPGSPLSVLYDTYGVPDDESRKDDGKIIYRVRDSDCWMKFSVEVDRVRFIKIECPI